MVVRDLAGFRYAAELVLWGQPRHRDNALAERLQRVGGKVGGRDGGLTPAHERAQRDATRFLALDSFEIAVANLDGQAGAFGYAGVDGVGAGLQRGFD